MAKKKLGSLEDLGGFVFSTNDDFVPESDNESTESIDNNAQRLEVCLEKKGRGGKTVVIVRNFEGPEEDLNELGRNLKKYCSCGGSVKDWEIIIQGNLRDKVCAYLDKEGYSYKKVGG